MTMTMTVTMTMTMVWELLSIEKVTINGEIVLKYKIKLDISPKVKIFYNRIIFSYNFIFKKFFFRLLF